jgi:hypothetical protein
VLPVHFSSFTAGAADGGVDLKWATAQEQNNKGFVIERSGGDGQFVQVGYVRSSNVGGNSAVTSLYTYVDRGLPAVERVSYRIRQEDLDGKVEYSSVIYVSVPRSAVNVYAAGKQVNVVLPSLLGFEGCSILVYDSQGRLVKRVLVMQSGMTVINGLAGRSVYYVTVRSGSGDVRVRKGVYVE